MAGLTTRGTAVRGIASAVPVGIQSVDDLAKLFGAAEAEKIAQATGVRARRVSRLGQCCSDLCNTAAETLFAELGWNRAAVDALVYVSHSFDHPLPATSCILQHRLGLPKSCATFDVALGCSGYIYGLWICSGLISSGCKRVLLLAGDIASRMVSPTDRCTVPLFGDAGTATALESDDRAQMFFELGGDGSGYKHMIIPAGTSTGRVPHSAQTMVRSPQADSNLRSAEDLSMNGAEIFASTLREVPPMMSAVMERSTWMKEEVDQFFFNQANEFVLMHLARRMGLPPAKVPMILKDFGNTSSASIPLTITLTSRETLARQNLKLVMAGFGVGFSWGACALQMGPIVAPALVEVP